MFSSNHQGLLTFFMEQILINFFILNFMFSPAMYRYNSYFPVCFYSSINIDPGNAVSGSQTSNLK